MSYVDNVILSISILEDCVEPDSGPTQWPLVDRVNAWLRDECHQQFGPELSHFTDVYGGSKVLEATMFVGAFNYLPEDDFLEFLATLPWEEPQHVQVIIKRQHEDEFVILWPCRGVDVADAHHPRTVVLGETHVIAQKWCHANGVRPFSRHTLILDSPVTARGFMFRPGDRLVFVGDVERRRDYRDAFTSLLPALQNVGGDAFIERVPRA